MTEYSHDQIRETLSPNLILVKSLKTKIDHLPEEVKTIPFNRMGLSVRSNNILCRENALSPEALLQIPNEEIIKWPGLGKKCIQDILNIVTLISSSQGSTKYVSLIDSYNFFLEKDKLLKDPNIDDRSKLFIAHLVTPHNWINKYFFLNPNAKIIFIQAEITSELSYALKRSKLSKDILMEADTFRFNNLIKQIDTMDPLIVLSISPEWLLNMEVFYFDCGARNKNIIKNCGIERLIEFFKLTLVDLKLMPNMGRKSIKELSRDIINAQAKGPPPKTEDITSFKGTLKENFFNSLERIKDEKQHLIIEERLGVKGKVKTLDEISTNFGITRERVRQIQNKVIAKIIDGEFWDDVLGMKLKGLLVAPTKPLCISQLSKHDPWFDGFDNNANLLQKICEHFSNIDPIFLYLEGKIFITKIDNDTWKNIKSALIDTFEYGLDLQHTWEDIEMLIEHELTIKNAKELSGLMFDAISPQLNFSIIDEEMVLTSIGNSMRSHLKTLLEEAEKPMHYSEIQNLYKQKYGVERPISYIHSRLANGEFCLFGRGIYGTDKHLELTREQQEIIIRSGEEFLEKNSHRQCHTQEILKAFKETPQYKNMPNIDKYILNILLAKSNNLSYLGKMVWVYGAGVNTDTERLHIRKTVADILKEKGRAMRIEEIEKDLVKVRSVGINFSVTLQPNELFSRVDPATWGLLDRDFILSPKKWANIKEYLYQNFIKTNRSLHTSELPQLVKSLHLNDQITLGHIVGILSADDRFKKWRGGFIGLSSWNEPNRITLSEALDMLIDKSSKTISTDMLEKKIENILGYSFKKNRVSMYLNKNGFTYNRKKNIWGKST